jgi:class 3 adenylate cyclase/tetratricopeptide (TPR) repeat protein
LPIDTPVEQLERPPTSSAGPFQKYILLTDIGGSSGLIERYPAEYRSALTEHNSRLSVCIAAAGGEVMKWTGDGCYALFDGATAAVEAAVSAQVALSPTGGGAVYAGPAPDPAFQLQIRTAVHGGRLEYQDGEWHGEPLYRLSRIGAVCHPGQIAISSLVRRDLGLSESPWTFIDLGWVRLRGLARAEQLWQLTHPRAERHTFPPPAGLETGSGTEFERAVRAHCFHYATRLERDAPLLDGGGHPDDGALQEAALLGLEKEVDNFIQSLESALVYDDLACLLSLGRWLSRLFDMTGSFSLASDVFGLLLDAAGRLDSMHLELLAELGRSSAFERLGCYGPAQVSAERASALATALGDDRGRALALTYMGNVSYNTGEFTAAREAYRLSLDHYRRWEHGAHLGLPLANLGLIELCLGNFDAAEDFANQGLAAFTAHGDSRGEAWCWHYLGSIAQRRGDYLGSCGLHQRALALRRRLQDPWGESVSLLSLGNAESCRDDEAAAARCYAQALSIASALGTRQLESRCLYNLGKVQYKGRNWAAAKDYFQQALEIETSLGVRHGEAQTLSALATVFGELGEPVEARLSLRRALEIFCAMEAKEDVVCACISGASRLFEDGQIEDATKVLFGSTAQATKMGYHFEPDFQADIDAHLADLEALVDKGNLTRDQLAQWKSEGEAPSFHQLARLTLDALTPA